MTTSILLAMGAYFWGGIPTANILARLVRGVDLRSYGSQSVTSSNAGQLMGRWAVSLVGVLDILKGAAPIWGAQALDVSATGQMAAGIAVVGGHNWSPFLGFQGGRGMAAFLGVLLAAAPLELALWGFVSLFGVVMFGSVPLWLGLSTLLVPVWAGLLREVAPVIWGTSGVAVLVVAKRLTGNKLGPILSPGRGRVLLYRFLFDRDTRDRAQWVRRGDPSTSAGSKPIINGQS